jgi:hypothetical protein
MIFLMVNSLNYEENSRNYINCFLTNIPFGKNYF